MSSEKIFPSWRYHKDLAPIVIHNQKQHDKLESDGWRESPAHFEVKKEEPKKTLEQELAELKDDSQTEDESPEGADGDPDSGSDDEDADPADLEGDLKDKTVKQLGAILKEMGATDEDIKGKKKAELIQMIEG